jgi:hypothetical protein
MLSKISYLRGNLVGMLRVTVKVGKKGCKDTVSPVSNTFDATSLLGILIDFGLISIPVDLISGAAWKFNPKMYTVTPICESSVG